jgi:hypothetical protein
METPSTYTFDRETIKLNAYRLLCLFYANKEIARMAHPEDDDSASELERKFFDREMTQLLLNIAIAVRTLDDQMNALPASNIERQSYVRARDEVNKWRHPCMMFDSLTLRETCNKVIHATTVAPSMQEGAEVHEYERSMRIEHANALEHYPDEQEPDSVRWHHLSGNIWISGVERKKSWSYLLTVPIFVAAIYELLAEAA